MASTENVPPAAPDAPEPSESAAAATTAADKSSQSHNDESAVEDASVQNTSADHPDSLPPKPTSAEAMGDNATAPEPEPAPEPAAEPKTGEEPAAVAVTEGETTDQSGKEEDKSDGGPELAITLLLTTGARHPFKIDGKYLRRRSVNVENDDPFNLSVYTLKELIWREWRPEWEPRPTSPSYIRLISFGKLLDDKSPLTESSLTTDTPNVIHMTVKPQEVADEEDTKGGKSYSGRDRDASERSPSCRCVIL
ncbi:ubiquitin-related domain-containing protein [Talaromyces proteolyticus]|uniref:Ubiquitin-related domain-containing protein n=1 Tax=Talaromyces proteolyticus TaxID=1131652 RepID=A0AAD4PV53_9EURO|nr:ubiquitin-related domain-containing protein [Talaromyces proteolyticus]KAH8696140.1 ubiquitin-related domain-containing protein [Talaromyces proteolyticus]